MKPTLQQMNRCQGIYILDRRFSSLMGAPVSINDADVTVTLTSPGLAVHRCEALAMHVELSRIITSVLNCKLSAVVSISCANTL